MKCFLFLAVFLCIGSVAGAQKIDSLYVDTISNPNTLYVKIKLPDTGYVVSYSDMYELFTFPEIISTHLFFRACSGYQSLYFDTVLNLQEVQPYTLWLWIGEDVNHLPWCESRSQATVTDSFQKRYYGNLGVSIIGKRPRITTYPNPANQIVTVNDALNHLATATITNMQGQLIYQSNPSGGKASIDLKEYPPGIYLLRVKTTDGELYSEKLVISR